MKIATFNSIIRVLLAMLVVCVTTSVVKAQGSFTVNIDNVSRVAVTFQKYNGEIVESPMTFNDGDNVVEITDEYAAILFNSANENSIIDKVYFSQGEEGYDVPKRNAGYTVYIHEGINGAIITVTTSGADVSFIQATVYVDNLENLYYFQNVENTITKNDLKNGENSISFNPISDNSFGFMIDSQVSADNISVTLNGETVPCGYNSYTYYGIMLEDGDFLKILTEPTSSNPEELPSNDNITTIITTLPEDVTSYGMFGKSITFNMEGGINQFPASGFVSEVAFAGNGDVYIKTPISLNNESNSYLKGTCSDGIITVNLPQKIYCEDWGWGYGVIEEWAARLDFVYEEGSTERGTFKAVANKYDKIQFVYNEESGELTVYNPNDEIFMLGSVNVDNNWMGYGDMDIELTRFVEPSVNIPNDVKIEKWYFSNADRFVDIAFNGNDIYVNGLFFFGNPEYWVKGSIENGIVTFDSEQYLGVYEGWYSYFWGVENVNSNIPSSSNMTVSLKMAYDEDAKTLTAFDNSGFIVNAGNGAAFVIYTAMNPEIYFEEVATDVILLPPYNLNYETYVGEAVFSFYIPIKTADGKRFDVTKLSYMVWVDDGFEKYPFTFYTDEYDLPEDTDEIAFTFFDGWDFGNLPNDQSGNPGRSVFLYLESFDNLGVQLIYTNEDGSKSSSQISWLQTTGIENESIQPVFDTTYFNLYGQRVSHPQKGGMYIKQSVSSDGKVQTIKVLK